MNNGSLSASDVLALSSSNRNADFLEGNGILIILFFLIFMGGFNGFGGNSSYQVPATKDYVSEQFNTQNLTNKLDTMSTGLGNATWNLNDGIHMLGNKIDSCCCETNRNIDAVRYENAKNTCDIINANHNETQRILDSINHYAMEQKDMKIAEQSQLLSEQRIVAQMKPVAPVPAYPVANPYTGCCGYNTCGSLY